MKTLEIVQRPEVRTLVRFISDYMREGLEKIMQQYPDFFIGIRQHGVVMGLEFNHQQGAKPVMKHLYHNGVWAIFSTLDASVLQFKPGLLMTQADCEEVLRRVEIGIGLARDEVMGSYRRSA
jgi:acetylornithine/succinyldiaminopimelate/putrescine aminotransferase